MLANRATFSVSAALLACALAACSNDESAVPSEPRSKADSAHFLTHTTFGPTLREIDRLETMTYEAWLNEQFDMLPTYHLPQFQALAEETGTQPASADRRARMEVWWNTALNAPDQLRQRVAFALSEVMVVSDHSAALGHAQEGLAYYYDILVRYAFGNYRALLEQVTLSPEMGRYLSMLGNRKPNPDTGVRADENYAREVMQLFSIGLVMLNIDGTPVLDGNGEPVPTYSQADIENLARVFTGWTWADTADEFKRGAAWLDLMVPFENFHDTDAKVIVTGRHVPAGGTARRDLEIALDTLYQHPNVGPFIGRHLIQRLVTSNPSPAYVARVASVFNDNGHGVRGDLRATVRAVLMDPEALRRNAPHFGKVREPLLVVSHLWRAFDARAQTGRYAYWNPERDLGQAPLSAHHVFNFFSPTHSPPGEIRDAGLVAPELELANESSITLFLNRLYTLVFQLNSRRPDPAPEDILIRLDREEDLADDPDALVDHLNVLLMSGRMSAAMRATLVDHVASVPASDPTRRAAEAIYLVISSPQYLTQN